MSSINPPVAKRIPHSYTVNDHKIDDHFFWLRSMDWPKTIPEEVTSYIEEENNFTSNFFNQNSDTTKELFEELKSRIKLEDQSAYTEQNNYYYYTRTEETKPYTIFCRKHGSLEAEEEVLLDLNEIAREHKFISVGDFSISPDDNLLAYSLDRDGSERYKIEVIDLKNGKKLIDKIENNTIGRIVWHEKILGFFYANTNELWRTDKVFFHKLGDDSNNDILIYQENDPIYSIKIYETRSKQYLSINSKSFDSAEVRILNLEDNSLNLKLFQARIHKLIYRIEHNGDNFFILANDSEDRFKLFITSINDTQKDAWQEFVVPNHNEYLDSFDISSNFLILNYKSLGLPEIKVLRLSDKTQKPLEFCDEAFSAKAYVSNYKNDDIRVKYSSLKQPTIIWQYDHVNNLLKVLKEKIVPNYNKDEYIVKRVHADNGKVKVPISLVYKKSMFKQDGSNPLYLYGYGSYGVSIPASFSSAIISLVDRGFVFAIAHIRGGDDLGYNWYQDAKFLKKKNTFEDFIACTNLLIQENYTKKGNIVVAGGSAGGMLIGAVINMSPNLYKAAIAHVPFVDVLNTMLDDSLPLTPGEFKEWGNPKEEEIFNYMKSYSPYDNVSKQAYPHIYATASTTDPRVGYWEALKWVAKLRSYKTDQNLLMLKINTEAGHQGSTNRFEALKEVAEEYTFILACFNLIKAK